MVLVAVRPLGSVMVTVKPYVPALLTATVAVFAALLPLALKDGVSAPVGSDVVSQVYVRLLSSVSTSAPNTERPLVVPVTGLGVALAGISTVGACSAATVTDAWPSTPDDPEPGVILRLSK
jgi:hypothetical protein